MIGMPCSRRIGLDAARRLVAVHHRQLDVHQDQVRPLALRPTAIASSPSPASIIS